MSEHPLAPVVDYLRSTMSDSDAQPQDSDEALGGYTAALSDGQFVDGETGEPRWRSEVEMRAQGLSEAHIRSYLETVDRLRHQPPREEPAWMDDADAWPYYCSLAARCPQCREDPELVVDDWGVVSGDRRNFERDGAGHWTGRLQVFYSCGHHQWLQGTPAPWKS